MPKSYVTVHVIHATVLEFPNFLTRPSNLCLQPTSVRRKNAQYLTKFKAVTRFTTLITKLLCLMQCEAQGTYKQYFRGLTQCTFTAPYVAVCVQTLLERTVRKKRNRHRILVVKTEKKSLLPRLGGISGRIILNIHLILETA